MEAASLETSEPDIFMAIPRSAFLRAGESFTPSPVTPTICLYHGLEVSLPDLKSSPESTRRIYDLEALVLSYETDVH